MRIHLIRHHLYGLTYAILHEVLMTGVAFGVRVDEWLWKHLNHSSTYVETMDRDRE